jgi:hypothetical protein
MIKRLLLTGVLIITPAVHGWAYDQIQVANGGTLKGRVTVSGNIPKDETIQVSKDQAHCGDSLPREKYVLSGEGGVKNAVVFIEEIKAGKALPSTPVEIDNVKCAFVPHVQVGAKGQDLIIKNTDPMLHNTHIYLDKKTVFNFALPVTGMEIRKPVKKTGVMSVECDAHAWMKGYLYMHENPYITTTDKNGNFSLTDIPPGTYKIKIWHEALGEQGQSVTVSGGGATEIKVDYKR